MLLTLTLDTRFHYYQLAFIKHTSSSGAVSGIDVSHPQPITSFSQTYTYTGADSEIETTTTIEDIFAERKRLEEVVAHTIKDGRLFVANTKNTNKSYVGFQRHASRIQVTYETLTNGWDNALSKDPSYYFGVGSFLHDEVYALGIVYVFTDGTESPVFHIPGRATFNNNVNQHGTNPYLTANAAWDTLDVTGDVNVFNAAKTKRWQVYNTFTEGAEQWMGYYETTSTYPTITVCNDDDPTGYWGVDASGAAIVAGTTKIRHHRMPAIPTGTGTHTNFDQVGIKFSIPVDYPSGDIAGHFFVFSDRTNEHTIVDKGIITSIADQDGGNSLYTTGGIMGPQNSIKSYGFLSPAIEFDEQYSGTTYLTVERTHKKFMALPFPFFSGSITNDQYHKSISVTTSPILYKD